MNETYALGQVGQISEETCKHCTEWYIGWPTAHCIHRSQAHFRLDKDNRIICEDFRAGNGARTPREEANR